MLSSIFRLACHNNKYIKKQKKQNQNQIPSEVAHQKAQT